MAVNTGVIELADFRAGIQADYHGGIAATSRGSIPGNGAAVIDGTFGCCADMTGALVPLPLAVTTKTDATIYQNDATTHHPAAFRAAYLTDAYVSPQSASVTGWNIASTSAINGGDLNGEGQSNVAVLYQHWTSFAGTSAAYKHAWLGRIYRNGNPVPNSIDFLWSVDNTSFAGANFPRDLYSGSLSDYRTATAWPLTIGVAVITALAVAVRVLNPVVAATPIPANELGYTTFETDISANYPTAGVTASIGNGYLLSYPNPEGAGFVYATESVWVNPGGTDGYLFQPILLASHQGRVVVYDKTGSNSGANNIYVRDTLFYTPVMDFKSKSLISPFTFDPGPENVSGIGVLASTNTDELLVIKHRGGAILLRGDLDNPTVVRLPGVESTYGISAAPVNTPLGLVYGTRNGVFLWGGGQVSEKLSPQIEGFFWNHVNASEQYEAHRGRFGWFHPWVAVPNNFLYDTRTKAWWRLSDPTDRNSVAYNVYCVDPTNGKMLAFPYKLTAAQTVVYDTFDPTVLRSSYTWRSQPLVETLDQVSSFNSITVVASMGSNASAATVALTLTGYDKNGAAIAPVTTTVNIPAGSVGGQPVIIKKDIDRATEFNAMYVQALVTATSTTGAAPKIHRINIEHGTRSRNPKS